MFKSVLIGNRGEISVRAGRTFRKMGILSIVIYSEVDCNCGHVSAGDDPIELKGSTPGEIYLRSDLIIVTAQSQKVDAIFPVYGFWSENVDFAIWCSRAGICFIGPTSEEIRQFGLKHIAYEIANAVNLPLLPHSGLLIDLEEAKMKADSIVYPVMLKSTAGWGVNGMYGCENEYELIDGFEKVCRAGDKFD